MKQLATPFVPRSSPVLPLTLSMILCIAAAAGARADAVHLAWDACASEGGTLAKSFACNTNSGSDVLVASFVLDAAQPSSEPWAAGGMLIVSGPYLPSTLSDWWNLQPGGCRAGALTVSGDFSQFPQTSCFDPYQNQALALPAQITLHTYPYHPPDGGGSSLQIDVGVQGMAPADLAAGAEYLAFRLVIPHTHTVGAGACGGCCEAGTIMLQNVVVGSGNTVFYLTQTAQVDWQTNGGCGVTPTRSRSWGQLRAMFR